MCGSTGSMGAFGNLRDSAKTEHRMESSSLSAGLWASVSGCLSGSG